MSGGETTAIHRPAVPLSFHKKVTDSCNNVAGKLYVENTLEIKVQERLEQKQES